MDLFRRKERRFHSESEFKKNMASQLEMTPQTLEELYGHGVKADASKKLEFFFYTDSEPKASALASVLTEKGYSVEHGIAASSDDTYTVTGWTAPLQMDKATVLNWTRAMCELGYEHDCEFDGWGTDVG